ncbi:MAG TPA: glycosyltransferase [Terriglobia bacterium]|nr:glycosyltransferase [Terriglobia bacterium]
MKLLIYTHAFAPKIGGVETVVMTLATGLAKQDHAGRVQVTLATATPRSDFDDNALPFRVVRQPSLPQLFRLIRAADVVHLAGPCFVPMLAGLLFRKPVVVEHHGFQTICPNGQLLHEPLKHPAPDISWRVDIASVFAATRGPDWLTA